MLRIVSLGQTGVCVMLREGELATVAGRCHWNNPEEARRSALTANIPVSDVVIRTAA